MLLVCGIASSLPPVPHGTQAKLQRLEGFGLVSQDQLDQKGHYFIRSKEKCLSLLSYTVL